MTVAPRSDAASPIDIAKTIERARAAWRAGRADEAEMACRQVLAVWPGQTDASYLMGLMAYDYGNLDLAIEHVRQACQSPRAPAIYFSDFGEMCRQAGLLAEGEQAARRAVALQPSLAAAWNNLGIILQEALKLDESRASLERALALEPNNPQTLNNLANTFKRLGLAAEAEKRWQAALELRPDYAEAFSNLANLYNDQGEFDRAEAMARRAIELSPRLADAHINLAGIETARHRHPEALRALDAILTFAPAHARALAAKALTLKDLDRLEEAMDWAKRAVVVGARSPRIAQRHRPGLSGHGRSSNRRSRLMTAPPPSRSGANGRDRQPRRRSSWNSAGRPRRVRRWRRRPRRSRMRRGSCSARPSCAGSSPTIRSSAKCRRSFRARGFRFPTAPRCTSVWARPCSIPAIRRRLSATTARPTG